MNEYLAFQLYIQVFWEVVLVYSALYITVQCLSLLVIYIEETYVDYYDYYDYHLIQWTLIQNILEVHFVCIYTIISMLLFLWYLQFGAD